MWYSSSPITAVNEICVNYTGQAREGDLIAVIKVMLTMGITVNYIFYDEMLGGIVNGTGCMFCSVWQEF